jgi:hypothetical protein
MQEGSRKASMHAAMRQNSRQVCASDYDVRNAGEIDLRAILHSGRMPEKPRGCPKRLTGRTSAAARGRGEC